jgi:sugar lactone lactonase YvrE
MKTLHLAIIIGVGIAISIMAGMIVTVISAPQHVPADMTMNKTSQIEISDITTSPETITIGESFQIYATIKNNNPYPISFGTGCGSPLSVSFDKNVLVNETVLPCPFSPKEILESGQETRIHGPGIGTSYNATLTGDINAYITFSYEMDGRLGNITVSKYITIYPPRTAPASPHNIESLQISPNGTNGTIGTNTPQLIPQVYDNAHNWTYLTDGKISSIKISSDGSLIVVGTNTDRNTGSVYLFDNHGLLLWQKTLDRRIADVAISPDNSFISASGFQLSSGVGQFYENGKIYFFDIKGSQLWDHEAKGYEAISSISFYPNDSVVTTINDTVIDFDKKGNTVWKFSTNDYLRNVSASQDGSFVAAYSSNKIYFLDSHGHLLWTFVTDDRNIDRVILSHDGRYVVTGDATSGYDGTIYFLDNTGKLLWKNPVGGPLLSVSISKNYSIAATNNWQIYLFDSKGMQIWKDNIPSLVTISSDGSFDVGTTYANGTNRITFFDRQGNIVSNYPISDYTTTFTLSQDDKYFVIVNGQDHNQVSFFELGYNISHQNIVANLTGM